MGGVEHVCGSVEYVYGSCVCQHVGVFVYRGIDIVERLTSSSIFPFPLHVVQAPRSSHLSASRVPHPPTQPQSRPSDCGTAKKKKANHRPAKILLPEPSVYPYSDPTASPTPHPSHPLPSTKLLHRPSGVNIRYFHIAHAHTQTPKKQTTRKARRSDGSCPRPRPRTRTHITPACFSLTHRVRGVHELVSRQAGETPRCLSACLPAAH